MTAFRNANGENATIFTEEMASDKEKEKTISAFENADGCEKLYSIVLDIIIIGMGTRWQ